MSDLHRPADVWKRETSAQLTKAAIMVVLALGASEQLRYRWRRAQHATDRWLMDIDHRERDQLLRSELLSLAGHLAPVLVPWLGSSPGGSHPRRTRSPRDRAA